MAVVHCEKCGHTQRVPERHVGRKIACPSCGEPAPVEPEPEDLGLDDVIAPVPNASAPQGSSAPLTEATLFDQAEEEPSHILQGNLLRNLLAGLVSGATGILFCLAIALLFVSGTAPDSGLPHALSMALMSAGIVGLVVAIRSGVAFALAGPESMAAVVLFLLSIGIHSAMPADAAPLALATTTTAAIMITTVLAGFCLWLVGGLGAGDWIRFIPIHAVGGVLAGVGFLVLRFAIAHGTGCVDDLSLLLRMFEDGICLKWLPGLGFGLLLFVVLRGIKSPGLLFALLLLGIGAAHGGFFLAGMDIETARMNGWLFPTFAQDRFWDIYSVDIRALVNLGAIVDNAGYIAALVGLLTAGTMLKITELEIVMGREIDLNREYMGIGMGNLLSGLAGGIPGSLALSRSLANKGLGAQGAVAGIVAALVCIGALFSAHLFIPYIPRFVPVGLLVCLGLSLMWRWLVETRARFTHKGDYALLVLVFLLTASLGLLVGVGVGAGLAMLVTAGRYGSMSVIKHEVSGEHFHSNVDRAPAQFRVLKEHGAQIHVITLQGFIFLGTTSNLLRRIRARLRDTNRPPLRFLLLDFTFIGGLDSSVALSFTKLQQMAAKHGFTLVFTNMPFELEEQLKTVGCVLNAPERHSLTVTSLDYAMEWAEDHLLDDADLLAVDRQSLPKLLEPVFPEPRYIPLLMRVLKRVQVKKGAPVFRQGDPSDAMYFIESGMVNVQLELEGGKVLRLKKMGPGTAFGEMGIYTSAPRSASIVAAEDCVLYRLSTKVLHQVQAKIPHLAEAIHRFIVNLLSERVSEANAKVRDLLA